MAMTKQAARNQAWAGWLRLAVASAAGFAAALMLPRRGLVDVSQELIALAGLIMAGVLPTMMLTATVLRSGGLSVKRIRAYEEALTRQAQIWAGLFLLSLTSSGLILVGKMWVWQLPTAPTVLQVIAARFLTFLSVALIAFLLLRARAVFDGLLSLIRLSADIAVSEAQAKVEHDTQAIAGEINVPSDPSYGAAVKLPH